MENKNRLSNQELINKIAEHYKAILELIGEDPTREGLVKTPQRAAKALLENTVGYDMSGEDIIKAAVFEHPGSQMVIVGLSKVARMVDVFARRLQVQERLTAEICEALAKSLPNKGVIVRCEAQHLCMKMRGAEKQESTTVTLEYSGAFENVELRNEFFGLLK